MRPSPWIGFLNRREEILTGASVKVTQNWVLLGSVRYDLAVNRCDQTRLGIGYTDDCLLLSLNYLTSYTYTGHDADTEQHVHAAVELAYAWTRLPGSDRFRILNASTRTVICKESGGVLGGMRERTRRCPSRERHEVRSEISFRVHCKGLAAVAFAGAIMLALPTAATAQQVVAFVNGQPITVLDIEHRSKFLQMSNKKVPSRKEVMDSLIDEILEINEAKRFGLDIPDEQVNKSYNTVATRMGIDGPEAHAVAHRRWRQR